MGSVILYGSQYGSARRYAEAFSRIDDFAVHGGMAVEYGQEHIVFRKQADDFLPWHFFVLREGEFPVGGEVVEGGAGQIVGNEYFHVGIVLIDGCSCKRGGVQSDELPGKVFVVAGDSHHAGVVQ